MALNKNNKGKKDLLRGAMDNEISNDGIMGDFIDNVQKDKKKTPESSDNSEKAKSSLGSIIKKEKLRFEGAFPMIRNSGKREWWISLGAFISVILLVIILITTLGAGNQYQLHLASGPVDNFSYGETDTREVYEQGKPVYVYFASKSKMKTDKIFIQVINLNETSDESIMANIESNINPDWKIVETHFQKEYFENPGKYKIIIQNAKNKVLVEKVFTIK